MTSSQSDMLIWYCGHCRRVLKCEPTWAEPRGCKCQVPMLPPWPTKVSYA